MAKSTFAALRQVEGEALRWGTSLEWGITICVVVCGLILGSIILARILYRGRQTEPNALWLHLLALGLFPLFLLPLLNFTILE